MSGLRDADRPLLAELEPVLRRAAGLEPHAVCRLRFAGGRSTALVRLPFGVLVSRSVEAARADGPLDVTVRAGETLAWLAGERAEPPDNRDAEWRGGTPPSTGWRRLETVPDDVIRGLVRSGALALKDAAAREGVPGAQPRAEVADALLDSVVLTVDSDGDLPVDSNDDANKGGAAAGRAEVTLRSLSALTRMGFLPRGGVAAVDVAGRWTRIAAGYGSVYAERPGAGLTLN